MRSSSGKPLQQARSSASHQAASAAPSGRADAPPMDAGWYESSYELMRGLDVVEGEWSDTATGACELDHL
jgi:hypothetical protein